MQTYRQMYEAIRNGDDKQRKAATLQLLGIVQVAATAILELNGYEKLNTGKDVLMDRSRVILRDFIGLESREG